MKINDKIFLSEDKELRLYFYNDDSNFKDHETQTVKEGVQFIVVGYVPEKSNNIRTDEDSGDFENYAYVLKGVSNNELFRVSREVIKTSFIKSQLN